MGKRYSYGDPRMEKLLKAFFHAGDFDMLKPLHLLPYMLHMVPYIPILKNDVRAIRNVTIFLKVWYGCIVPCKSLTLDRLLPKKG